MENEAISHEHNDQILTEQESSMDGVGSKVKKILGFNRKKDDSYTHTATLITADKKQTDQAFEGQNEEASSEFTLYKDKATAMLSESQTQEVMSNEKDNKSSQCLSSITMPVVISPDENNVKPGLALIITGQNFEKGMGSFRSGAEKDLRNMFDIFHLLNFEIRWQQFVDRTTEELKNELIKCAKDPSLEQKKCLVIIVSSHGGEVKLGSPYRPEEIPSDINVYGHAITTYNGMIPTSEIMDIFDDDRCPYMEGKPKLFFIQACRLRNRKICIDPGFEVETTESSVQTSNFFEPSTMDVHHSMETEPGQCIQYITMKDMLLTPCYEDYMVVFASSSEHVAWSEDTGGVLLTAMYEVFKKKIKQKEDIDLLPTMIEVCNQMIAWESNFSDPQYDKAKSAMCLLHMLTEEIIFKPKY